jgi:putative ABC transport system substrate-binding protein
VFPDDRTIEHRKQIAEFAIKHRLPSMFGWSEYVEAGGLISYGPNRAESLRRVAVYVDKILKGAKPADLPVEQPTKFELVINLKTAKQIGLTIPPNVLARADRVIR